METQITQITPDQSHITIPANQEVVLLDMVNNPELLIEVGENAHVSVVLLTESDTPLLRTTKLAQNANLEFYSALIGGKAHVEVTNEHHGNGSASKHQGVFIGQQRDRFTMRYLSKHIGQHTTSAINVHGVLLDHAYADFLGNVIIAESARHTEGSLDEHTLLLGERSRSDSVPQLEIDTNEVAASHSSSITKIDNEQLFYLASRGIGEAEARYMIVRGFIEEIVDAFPDQTTKNTLYAHIETLLLPATLE